MYGLSRPDYIVRCVEVKSGDTVVVEDATGQHATVRAYGIDAPEEDQPYGRVARRAARKVLKGKRVETRTFEVWRFVLRDLYGETTLFGSDLESVKLLG